MLDFNFTISYCLNPLELSQQDVYQPMLEYLQSSRVSSDVESTEKKIWLYLKHVCLVLKRKSKKTRSVERKSTCERRASWKTKAKKTVQ